MPTRCCVPGCKNRKTSFKFPGDENLCTRWRVAIRRAAGGTASGLWKPTSELYSRVCIDHFRKTDFKDTLMGERHRLIAGAVPSIFDFNKPSTATETSRQSRYLNRRPLSTVRITEPSCVTPDVECEIVVTSVATVSVEDAVSSDRGYETITETCVVGRAVTDEATQCVLLEPDTAFSHRQLVDNREMLKFYTSFENYDHFCYFLQVLGPAAYSLRKFSSIPDVYDQLLLTLMKLRVAKEDIELAFMFKVSRRTVSDVFCLWLNFMYFQLKELKLWPPGNVIEQHMPRNFSRLFPTTKLILDATEMPIEKPKDANAQSITFSTYKNHNTVKTMVGCTPRGAVVYVSDAYGGSASDRQIIERSDVVKSFSFQEGDSIMADRGIMVQDLFAAKNVKVNTPHMLRGKHQLSATEVVEDRRIASKRIHVERVIGLCKTFKILKKDMMATRLPLANRMIFVCFMINNFRTCIVGSHA